MKTPRRATLSPKGGCLKTRGVARRMLSEEYEPRNTRRLRAEFFIPAVFGGLGRTGSSGAFHPGVCGGAGFDGARLCGARERRGAAAVCERSDVEGVVVWVPGANPGDAAVGEGVPTACRATLADGSARAGSHLAVAVLAGHSAGVARGVSGGCKSGGGAGIDWHDLPRRGWDQDSGGGVAAHGGA